MSPFADTGGSLKTQFPERRKIDFLTLTPGTHLVRILQESAKRFDTHWVKNGSVICIGEECPICANNRRLMMEYSADKKFKEQKDWNPPTKRFFVNVFDRTPVKVCPQCGVEVHKAGANFPSSCPSCNTFITGIAEKPSNKIKVLSRGVTLFDQLNAFESSILDAEGNPISITNYDIMISVVGTGKNATVTPIPMQNKNDKIEVKEEDLFDLDNAVVKLSPNEIVDLLKGVSIRDIFLARGNREAVYENKTEKAAKIQNESVKKALDDLFA